MKLKIVIALYLAALVLSLSESLRAGDAADPAKPDLVTTPADPAKPDTATVVPQMDPAMAAALAQAMTILGRSGDDAGKNSTLIEVTKAIANNPAMSAAILQAAKMLAQSLANPTTQAEIQKQAGALSESASQDGKQLVRDNAPKVEGDDSRQAAQAEIEQAQQMAEAALANAAQAGSTATTTAGGDSLSTANQAVAGHASVNGLVDSVQTLGPDPADKNHHSLDSLF